MKTFKVVTTIPIDGSLVLHDLPFNAGQRVEVLIVGVEPTRGSAEPYPLRGTPYRFDDPTAPARPDDWESGRLSARQASR